MEFTVAAQASNRRVIQFNLAPIAGSDLEACKTLLENPLVRSLVHRGVCAEFRELS